ncbi:helix-turn-helix domain-containing protein [Leminorella grimontii]|uniref:helix-turn-helix domain-containing protein n=1 Tax=Leminorella grimontii TaxID=82981 RepID=UPI00321F7241
MNLPQKPQESTLRLVECISNIGEIYSHNQQVVFCQEIENKRKEFVFAVQEGKVEIYRKNVFIGELSAPCIMGLLQSCFLIDFYHLKPSSDSVMVATERSTAMEAITQKGLWNDVLNYQAYVFDILLYRRELIIKNSAYSVICNLLEELAKLPLAEREKISVGSYILKYSDMARSGMMRILSDLKMGGYIEMKRGKLIQICKKLPEKY